MLARTIGIGASIAGAGSANAITVGTVGSRSLLERSTAVVIASARSGRLTSMVATTEVGGIGSEAVRRTWSRSAMARASAAGTAGADQSCGGPKSKSGASEPVRGVSVARIAGGTTFATGRGATAEARTIGSAGRGASLGVGAGVAA